jgi:hypothetical protein
MSSVIKLFPKASGAGYAGCIKHYATLGEMIRETSTTLRIGMISEDMA